ncbi:uncharacterized protein LOC107023004 [Solanum pennellii]|uniref:Uncharacterized protein LOC107023004 n=1 Tax=Solanum pennellii TaxID=28526 RepID=A0ABM1H1H5_SOLPN|nr:uncharacterized protein LOC107023004 [Solanum pennellii]
MVPYTNAIACRVCDKIFSHPLPLLYHFNQVHGREGYVYTNAIACRVCDKIFSHPLPLLYHFDQVHAREGYVLEKQRSGYPVSRTTHFKLNSKQGHSQFASRANGQANFRSMSEESHSRGQVHKIKELNLFDFTNALIKNPDKPFIFENVEADEDQNVDLELKL